MRVLIATLNYAPEPVGIAIYSTGLATGLAERGHRVSVVAAQPYYPDWRTFDGYRGRRSSVEDGVFVVRVPIHVPHNPTGARRILHHLSWLASSMVSLVSAARRDRPEIVFAVAPSLIGAPAALIAAKMSGARTWLHVQDFEVEAAFATGLVDSRGFVSRMARRFQRSMLRAFDRVSTISPEMCARLRDAGVSPERIVEFRNWANDPPPETEIDAGAYRRKWGITTPHVALYSGNIANKQGLDTVIDAARTLRGRDDLMFVICGNGPNRERLEVMAADLPNVVFHDLQPIDALPDLLALATVHLLPQRADAADLVLPSKLTNMLASGRPTVAGAAPETGLAREVEGCGIAVAPGDGAAFAEAIGRLIDDPALRDRLGNAARSRARERWSRGAILADIERRLVDLSNGRRR